MLDCRFRCQALSRGRVDEEESVVFSQIRRLGDVMGAIIEKGGRQVGGGGAKEGIKGGE